MTTEATLAWIFRVLLLGAMALSGYFGNAFLSGINNNTKDAVAKIESVQKTTDAFAARLDVDEYRLTLLENEKHIPPASH
ncbi:MAG: hypothetical protein KGL39_36530 [Patescibacteria group bacterium]|nr:hypothetical protein [Patescibacteria group bacterium]